MEWQKRLLNEAPYRGARYVLVDGVVFRVVPTTVLSQPSFGVHKVTKNGNKIIHDMNCVSASEREAAVTVFKNF